MTGATMQAAAGPAGSHQATVTAAVYDAYNNPVPGAVVSFQVSSGSGTLASPTATTDASGLATDTVTGSALGTVTVQAGSGTLTAAPVTVSFVGVTTVGLPNGLAGAPYSATLAAGGGSGSCTWSATGLPPGLSVSSGGVVSGTPTAAGTYTVAVTVTDGAGYTDTVSLGLTVALNITTASLPDGLVGAPYNATLAAAGGSGSCTWNSTGLPPGLSVSSGGAVSGTPTTAGTYTVTVKLTDSAGNTASKNIGLTVYQPLSTITLPAATVGAYYSTTLAASGGGGSYTWSATGLPPGLSISSGGVISGTPTATGTYPVTVTVEDSVGHTTSLIVSLTVNPAVGALAVTTTSLTTGTVGASYSATLAAGGGTLPYTWSATGLPPGLSISSGGVISGTPSAAGTSTVTITVTDGAGNTASQNVGLTINPLGTLVVTTTSLPGGTVGGSYSATLAASGGSGSYTWNATGLPAGLSISSGGVISGTPSAAGTSTVTITVTDGAGNTANASLGLTVSQSGGGGGGKGGTSATPQPISITTGSAMVNPAAGGTVSLGSAVSLTIPAGALTGDAGILVTVQPASSAAKPPSGWQVLGTVYQFTVNGQGHYTFNQPVTLTFAFDPSKLPAGGAPAVHYYDDSTGQWVDIGGTVDWTNDTVTVTVGHFTEYAVMAQVSTQSAPPATLKDIAGNWAYANIEKLVSLGAITGYPDGTFRPNNDITRAEFVTVLVKALKLAPKTGPVFADTQGSWAQSYISTAAADGIVAGLNATHFGPNDLITREQMTAMVVRAAKLTPASGELTLKDADLIDQWARGYVVTAVKDGIVNGYPDDTFRPLNHATRAEAVTVIASLLK